MSSIGAAARQSGVAIETIRYYERTGIVPPPPRSASGRRVYGAAEIGRLAMIRRCRDLGFPLADVRVLLDLAQDQSGTCAEVKSLAEGHLAEVRNKLRDLKALETALAELVAGCAGGKRACPALRKLAQGNARGTA